MVAGAPPNPERMLGALLRIPFQAINERIARDRAAAGFGDLRPAHVAVFQHLPADDARPRALAERAHMTKQSMGALVASLVANGYLQRAPDPTDRRALGMRGATRGDEVERVARSAIGALEDEWRAALGAARMGHVRACLAELVALLERRRDRRAAN